MHTKVAVIFVQSLQGGDVGCSFYYLVHPLDCPYHLIAFCLSEDWGTLVLGNLSFKKKVERIAYFWHINSSWNLCSVLFSII